MKNSTLILRIAVLCCTIAAVIVISLIVHNTDAVYEAAAGVIRPGNALAAVEIALAAGGAIYVTRHRRSL